MLSSASLTSIARCDQRVAHCPGMAVLPDQPDKLGLVTTQVPDSSHNAFKSAGLSASPSETMGTLPVEVLTGFVTKAIEQAVAAAATGQPEARLNVSA